MPDYKRGVMRVAFQVMGVTAGRKDSNCEILLKEALLACREQGAEVRMINLKDYELLDCNGCTACTMGMSMEKITASCSSITSMIFCLSSLSAKIGRAHV